MESYSFLAIKLTMGIIGLVLQINLMGKGNLAPTSAVDQVQNYVLGGIIGAVIYNDNKQYNNTVGIRWVKFIFNHHHHYYDDNDYFHYVNEINKAMCIIIVCNNKIIFKFIDRRYKWNKSSMIVAEKNEYNEI